MVRKWMRLKYNQNGISETEKVFIVSRQLLKLA